ncbi:hypothetical protein [Rhodococcus sp. OK302]|uniref:hypothetical protein n=1 Tax=Rhodococcus sp. OK302 TaxID=1882769 RepID=UPI000B9407AB|nr:hypothetical protein [Rhodococcus sp. OK302]OYD61356.1 hypothetical protein BDB13_6329 [Rhodococcus sp. OK302]
MKRETFWSCHAAPTVSEALEVATREAVAAMHESLGADAQPFNISHTTTVVSAEIPQTPDMLRSLAGARPTHQYEAEALARGDAHRRDLVTTRSANDTQGTNMYPDRLDAIAAAAHTAGASAQTHNLGAVHAEVHHAALTLPQYRPARLPQTSWESILADHRR